MEAIELETPPGPPSAQDERGEQNGLEFPKVSSGAAPSSAPGAGAGERDAKDRSISAPTTEHIARTVVDAEGSSQDKENEKAEESMTAVLEPADAITNGAGTSSSILASIAAAADARSSTEKDDLDTSSQPPKDITEDKSSAGHSSPLPSIDDGLAPLPGMFDPDAPPPAIEHASLPEDDALAIVPREEEPESVQETEPEPEAMVEEEDKEPMDASFLELLRGLHDPEEDGDAEEDGEGDAEAPPEDVAESPAQPREETPMEVDISEPPSPLTPLPSDLPLESDFSLAPLPDTLAEAPAESSAAARARTPSPPPAPTGRSKRKGKQPMRFASVADEDELRALTSDDDFRPLKRGKGADGKAKPVPRARKRLDAQLGIERDGEQVLTKVQPRAKNLSDTKLLEQVVGKTQEKQLAPCLRKRYEKWGKCTQCVSKIGGDQCRFRNYRIFPLDPETGDIIGEGVFESSTLEEPLTPLPRTFNAPLEESHMVRTEATVAPLLLNLISWELRHVVTQKPIHRPVDTAKHRAVCDFCASTIFGGFWFCRKCGRDYCLSCERYFSDSVATLGESPWPLVAAAIPRLHRCAKRGDDKMHARGDLQPTSRFTEAELRANWSALANYVLEPGMEVDEQLAALGLGSGLADEEELIEAVKAFHAANSKDDAPKKVVLSEEELSSLYDASKDLPTVKDPSGVTPLPFMYIDTAKLDNETFDTLWARGEPMVAYGVGERFKLDWGPDAFIQRFGKELCYVIECQSERTIPMTIAQFFTLFKGEKWEGPAARPPVADGVNGSEGLVKERTAPTWKTVEAASSSEAIKSLRDSATSTPAIAASTNANEQDVDELEPAAGDSNGAANKNDQMDIDPPSYEPSTESRDAATSDPNKQREQEQNMQPQQPEQSEASRAGTPAQSAKEGTPSVEKSEDGKTHGRASPDGNVTANGAAKRKKNMILKLKDWPATDDFESAYPDLYNDFCDSLPVPDYTRRNGVLNLYSHFPPGPTRPDIGPKMYNAFEGKEGPGGQGSTRLHMDVADAINIMLHASPRADGTPGCAVWDLFRAEDADKIRDFLRAKYPDGKFADPIHSQMFYLDSNMRKQLFDEHGVASFRVYQRPGEAVFIPAGCAHQVCNLANCIKIALDFVSPHNVRRCQQLTQDFRKENFVKAWKDDVLQLYNVMWYAWTNVRETRARRIREAKEQEAAQASRHAHLASLAQGRTTGITRPPSWPASPRFMSPAMSSVRDEPAGSERVSSLRGSAPPSREATPLTLDSFLRSQAADGQQDKQVDGPEKEQHQQEKEVPEKEKIDVAPARTPDGKQAQTEKTTDTPVDTAKADEPKSGSAEDPEGETGTAPGKATLTRHLMEAAIAREPTPVALEPTRKKSPPPPPPQPKTSWFPVPEPASPPQPIKLIDSIRHGHIPMKLPFEQLKREMGGGGDIDMN